MQRKNLDDLTTNKQFNMLIDRFTSYIRTSSQDGVTTVNNSIMSISYPHDKHKLTFIFADGVKTLFGYQKISNLTGPKMNQKPMLFCHLLHSKNL